MRELLVDLGVSTATRTVRSASARPIAGMGAIAEEPRKLRRPNLPLLYGAATKPAPPTGTPSPEMTDSVHQASDHAAVVINPNL